MNKPKIEVLTFVFNEEFLLPYFLKHYGTFTSKIFAVYEKKSTDKTYEILKSDPNVEIIDFKESENSDVLIRQNAHNKFYHDFFDENTWVITVDVDEFVFPLNDWNKLQSNFNRVELFEVFRNVSEKDLDIALTIKENRKYGVPPNDYSIKPCFVKGDLMLNGMLEITLSN